jgi:hypothetical protein
MPLSNYSILYAVNMLYDCSILCWYIFQKDLVFKTVNHYRVLNTVLVEQKENLYKNNVPVRMLK